MNDIFLRKCEDQREAERHDVTTRPGAHQAGGHWPDTTPQFSQFDFDQPAASQTDVGWCAGVSLLPPPPSQGRPLPRLKQERGVSGKILDVS